MSFRADIQYKGIDINIQLSSSASVAIGEFMLRFSIYQPNVLIIFIVMEFIDDVVIPLALQYLYLRFISLFRH